MNTKIYNKITTFVLAFLALTIFGAASTFAQIPLRANGKIAFTSDRDGNLEIYVMDADGTNQVRITNNNIVDASPTWSPDGRKIAFESQKQDGSFAIFTMNADGTAQTEVTTLTELSVPDILELNTSLSWSPDGRKIAFSDYSVVSGSTDIFVVNTNGSGRRNLTADHSQSDIFPTWSPDGSKIIFSRYDTYPPVGYYGTMLHTINVDGTNLTPLVNGFADGWNEDSADWSPVVNKIVYAVNVWDFDFSIFIANADGTNRQLFEGCETFACFGPYYLSPVWSPDGSKIAFSERERFLTYSVIRVKNIDGSGITTLTNTAQGKNFSPSWQPLISGQTLSEQTLSDFDGDGRSDISVFRPSDGFWYLNRSTQGFAATQWGLATDKITPADYDGDGKTDIAVFRDGTWYWLNSSDNSFNALQFGLPSDIPVPADYTGDGQAELAVWRPSSGIWYVWNLSTNQHTGFQFGVSTDKPVVGDYDGDGKADFAVFRPSNGIWYIQSSTAGITALQFGLNTDKLVPADYDGDGKSDIAVYRPSNGIWYIQQSQSNTITAFQFGISTDVPAPADYDGDGRADAAVFRNGIWYLRQSTSGFAAAYFGLASDKPVPAAYLP